MAEGLLAYLHPSDLAEVYDGYDVFPAGSDWADILDSDDGDDSYAYHGTPPTRPYFYVNLDDASGLENATIQTIRIFVLGRSLSPDFTAALNINFRCDGGPETTWDGVTEVDNNPDYNIIVSKIYTENPAGEPLDLADINALQIGVDRGYSSPGSRVTEVYAEIMYQP